MPYQGNNSPGMTPFEQRLTQLTPTRSIDSEQLMFAAGQAETATRMRQSQLRWKTIAGCSTAAVLLLSVSLASSLYKTNQLQQNEIALQSQLDAATPNVKRDNTNGDREDWSSLKLAGDQPARMKRSPSPFLTIRDTRVTSDTDIASLPVRSRGTGGSSFSYGDFRRMSVVTDEFDRLRHLESLRP